MPDPQQRDEEAQAAPRGCGRAAVDLGLPPGARLLALERVDSTNAEARRLVEAGVGAPGLVLTAREQTAGRGRRGRSWTTVPGRSLAVSLVLEAPTLERLSRVTLWTAVLACRALEAAGSTGLAIKWPNDILRAGAKLGGILVEPLRAADGSELLIVGVGLNLSLRPGDLPDELLGVATDAGLPEDPALITRVRDRLASGLLEVAAHPGGALDHALALEYVSRSWLDGRVLELLHRGRRESVTLAGLTVDGDLRLGDGRVLTGEHVQLVAVR